jgi:serine/threonine protein kinase
MFIHAEREFKILQRLNGHPNIVEGVEYIQEFLRSRGYLVMEKILGQSILNLATNKGPISEEISKSLLRQILLGVNYMHLNGVVHRDLNPTNVFFNEETNLIKILDFNVSKLICLNSQTAHHSDLIDQKYKYSLFTKTGTPIYSAPEIHTAYRYT